MNRDLLETAIGIAIVGIYGIGMVYMYRRVHPHYPLLANFYLVASLIAMLAVLSALLFGPYQSKIP